MIVSGTVPEGDFLPREQELTKHFSVSRQAVREALKVLAAKGLVTSRRRAGTSVLPRSSWNLLDPDVIAWHPPRGLPPDLLADLTELRWLIEPAAAAFAARRRNSESVQQMGEALRAMRACVGHWEAFAAADVEFHRALFAASGNSLIDRLSYILLPLLARSFRVQMDYMHSVPKVVEMHVTVFEAIDAAEPARARDAMERLLEQASAEITEFAEQAGHLQEGL